jgi:prophage antirepressor-like protein
MADTSKQSALAFNAEPSQSTFNFNGHPIRVIVRDGEPWFVATDVCAALGYANTSKAVGDHLDDDERASAMVQRTHNDSLGVPTNIISESGLYALVLRSRKPEARKFAKWVTGEVLPSIRKNGGYGTISQERMDAALAMASEVAELAHRHVMQAVLAGEDPWVHDRWVFMFNLRDPRFSMGNGFASNGWAKRIESDAVVESPSGLAESISKGMWPIRSEDLSAIISACASRLELRSRQGRALAA